jgi:hypothetical protein
MRVADRYRRFARLEARDRSPLYEQLALGVADDPAVQAVLARVSPPQQQPNLLLATVSFLAGVQPNYGAFRAFVLDHADAVTSALEARRTQTNEVARCATLLPLLAGLRGPLALLEVGASAGLCLLPDRYAYNYRGDLLGDPASPVKLSCEPRGAVPVPTGLPQISWRCGIDLDPIDVNDAEAVHWLECCVWPGQPERLARLQAAIQVARLDPPSLIRGNLLDTVAEVARQAPPEATLVIFHSAVLTYLPVGGRRRFAEIMGTLPAVWVSNEGPGVVESLPALNPGGRSSESAYFIIGQGHDRAVALADPHGQWVEWLAPSNHYVVRSQCVAAMPHTPFEPV